MVERKHDHPITERNPFRPGAGHMPPYLAGRDAETDEFRKLLTQEVVLQNVVLTGLRGVGKTVLLETLRPIAHAEKWLWVGTDLSESATVDERSLVTRLLTDLSVVTSSFAVGRIDQVPIGFERRGKTAPVTLDFRSLARMYDSAQGLVSDKLKAVLEQVWPQVGVQGKRGVIFAYDEAQNLADHAEKEQYPLSLLLDVFQSLQRRGMMYMLVLTGLPTLFPKLVAARTYSERMFRIISLDRLDEADSRDAITKPIASSTRRFSPQSVDAIVRMSGGYPYFIQFICREAYDIWIQQIAFCGNPSVPVSEIQRKLDSDFFAGRWARVTDRQRELLTVIAGLPSADTEFTVQEIVQMSREILDKPFGASQVSQMLYSLGEAGLIYKNRHGRYSFAVPLLNRFILRQSRDGDDESLWTGQ